MSAVTPVKVNNSVWTEICGKKNKYHTMGKNHCLLHCADRNEKCQRETKIKWNPVQLTHLQTESQATSHHQSRCPCSRHGRRIPAVVFTGRCGLFLLDAHLLDSWKTALTNPWNVPLQSNSHYLRAKSDFHSLYNNMIASELFSHGTGELCWMHIFMMIWQGYMKLKWVMKHKVRVTKA